MHSKFLKISAAVFFSAALFSCSFDAPESDKGSISMRLPDKSQLGAACANGVSRSVSSDGSLSAGSVDQFKVVVRNISSRESITQFVAPGSSVTVDELEPGSWDVAIFGYANDPQGGSGQSIRYYGNARGIPVEGGETSNATVNLYDISGNMPGFGFNGVDPSAAMNIQYAYINYSCDDLSQSGDAFYSFNASDSSYDSTKPLMPPLPIFMEPGYAYKATANFYDLSGKCLYKGTAQGTVPAGGGLVEGTLNAPTDVLQATGTLNGQYVIGNSFADFVESYYPTFNYGSETIPCSNLSFKAINASACGLSVPYIASYGNSSFVLLPTVYHPTIVPSVSVSNKTVQKGQTITVSPSLSPSAPKAWPKLTTDTTVNGFSRYIVDSANSDQDTWTPTLACSDLSANKVEFNNNDKTLTGKAAGSNSFKWTVSVTPGPFGETPTTPTATANFTATCVEAAQPSGGGSGNVPADFVLVQGATISGKIGDGTGANASSVFIENRTITIPDMYVCAHEVTQSEYEQYCKYSGSTPSNSYGLGTNYPVYYVCYLDAIIYCNLRSAAEGLEPVYYAVIDGTSDENSLDYTAGTKSYNVDDWLSLYPTYGVTKDADGKYSAYSSYSQTERVISYPNRGITMDKTRNGYRLLTEAEWEYCARGGNGLTGTQTYYSGSDTLDAVAWNYNNSGDSDRLHQKAHPVMQLDSNGLGIFDMTGNVEEWVYGWVGDDAITATTPETGYVFNSSYTSSNTAKGGYWNWSDSSCNVNRHGSYNTYSGYEVGFRICRNKETRSLSGFKGIWSISPPARQTVAKTTGILKFFFQNNTASSSDYASFDPSKLIIKYDGTNHSFDAATMSLDKQADGVLLQMTNPNQNTGNLWYTFYYDGVEIGYVNTYTN